MTQRKGIVVSTVVLLITAALGYASALLMPSAGPDEAPVPSAAWSGVRIANLQGPALECALDPADVPPPEAGPDGRRPNYLHTCGSAIFDSYGREFQLVGITWSGMEYADHSPLGLFTRSWHEILDQIASLSYNTLRLPYTNDMLQPEVRPRLINYDLNPDLRGLSALEVLDRLVEGARQRGLRVILDRHRPSSYKQTPLWYTAEVSEEQWIGDWRMLARRYQGNDTVIGADLHNEPHEQATWGTGDRSTDWALAAERAGNAVLEVNPYLLIFVQGIDRLGDDIYWWGGDLRGVARRPVKPNIPNRVVYSPRDYGPEVYQQGYFSDPSFPNNLPKIWDEHWGYVHKRQIGPVVLGELGGTRLDDSVDGRWKRSLLNYLESNRIGFINWGLDPDMFDDPSALTRDTLITIRDEGRLYRASASIPDAEVEAARSTLATSLMVLQKTLDPAEKSRSIRFAVVVRNTTSRAIDLSRIELRYWFTSGELRSRAQSASATWARLSDQGIGVEIVPASQDGQHFYLRLTFDRSAGRVEPFSETDEIQVEIRKADQSGFVQTNDYSYSPNVDYEDSSRIGLYLDGQLIWGAEP